MLKRKELERLQKNQIKELLLKRPKTNQQKEFNKELEKLPQASQAVKKINSKKKHQLKNANAVAKKKLLKNYLEN